MAREPLTEPQRPERKKPASLALGPFVPAPYQAADIGAIKALQRGDATPEQQKRALDWIIQLCAGTYEFHYYPTSARDTDFALGKAFVGQQIVKMLKITTQRSNEDGNEHAVT